MELGATVCTPSEPDCPRCPVRAYCRACADGAQTEIPQPKCRPDVTDVVEACIAVEKAGRYLLRQRGPGERWAGLWDFPRFELNGHSGVVPAPEIGRSPLPSVRLFLEAEVRSTTGVEVELGSLFTHFRHAVTRFRIRLLCYEAAHRGGRLDGNRAVLKWVRRAEFDQFPLSTPARRVARLLAAGR
jgi:A/G-specific adenine glycosylase